MGGGCQGQHHEDEDDGGDEERLNSDAMLHNLMPNAEVSAVMPPLRVFKPFCLKMMSHGYRERAEMKPLIMESAPAG